MITENNYAMFFHDDKLLIQKSDQQFILPVHAIDKKLLNSINESDYYCCGEVDQKKIFSIYENDSLINKNYDFVPVRDVLLVSTDEKIKLICRAKQLLYWHRSSLFCGSCGTQTRLSETETAKICKQCQKIIYPCYSPAIIVLVEDGDRVLLARSKHFAPGKYSTLAGFIDAGETCEEAVMREVAEEVGIQIKDIEYFRSQLWPFPNSFMLGFRAKYASGEICIEPNEIEDAKWFSIAELPTVLPSTASIARHLIDSFVERIKNY